MRSLRVVAKFLYMNESTKIELKPDLKDFEKRFDISPNDIIKDVNENLTTFNKKCSFPLHSFPPKIQTVIQDFNQAYDLPIDYYAMGMLVTFASLIGNRYYLQYKTGYEVPSIIYGVIVGPSSIGKTPALNHCLRPLFKIEKEQRELYLSEKDGYNLEVKANPKTTKEKPVRNEIYINDATVEAVHKVHSDNPNGVLLFQDEVAAWVNSFNQYRSGSDEQFYLSNWSNSFAKVNRATKETLDLPKPAISVLGGIQPKLIELLGANKKQESGFLYRLLFAYPEGVLAPYDTGKEPQPNSFINYEYIVRRLFYITEINRANPLEYKPELKRTALYLSDDARVLYRTWKNKNIDKINSLGDDGLKSLYGKLSDYCLRFSLIFEIVNAVCNDVEIDALTTTIQEDTVKKAIELTEYFRETGHKVVSRINNIDPLIDYSDIHKKVYAALPESFTTGQGVEIAEKLKMGKRTFKRFLLKKNLFTKVRHGEYAKVL